MAAALKVKRDCGRSVMEKCILDKMKEFIETPHEEQNEDNIARITAMLKILKIRHDVLKKLDEEIIEKIEEKDMPAEMESSMQFDIVVETCVEKVERYMRKNGKPHVKSPSTEKNEKTPIVENVVAGSDDENDAIKNDVKIKKGRHLAKLPTLEIEKFDGEPLKWETFKETFKAAVDARTDVPVIQKFHYLHYR